MITWLNGQYDWPVAELHMSVKPVQAFARIHLDFNGQDEREWLSAVFGTVQMNYFDAHKRCVIANVTAHKTHQEYT